MLSPAQRECLLDLASRGQHLTLWHLWSEVLKADPAVFQEALQCAVDTGHITSVKWLAANPLCTVEMTFQVLCAAIQAGKVAMALVLLGNPIPAVLLKKILLWTAGVGQHLWVHALLQNPECTPLLKQSALTAASESGHLETVEVLLIHRAVPSGLACLGAVRGGHREVLLRLLYSNNYQLPSIKIRLVLEALKKKYFHILYDIRKFYPDLLEQVLLSLKSGDYERYLVQLVGYIQEQVSAQERNLLVQRLSEKGRLDLTQLLIEENDSILFKAVEAGDLIQIQMIARSVPELIETLREDLLIIAIRYQHLEIVHALFTQRTVLTIAILAEAVVSKNPQFLSFFLQQCAVVEKSWLSYLLKIAVEYNQTASVRLLVEKGALVETQFGSLMQQSIKNKNLEMLKVFIETGKWVSSIPEENYEFLKKVYFSSNMTDIHSYITNVSKNFGFSPIDFVADRMPMPRAHLGALGEKMRLAYLQRLLKESQAVLAQNPESAMHVAETKRCRDHFDSKIKTDFHLNAQFTNKGGLEGVEKEIRFFLLNQIEQQLIENTTDCDYTELLNYIEEHREPLVQGIPLIRTCFRELIQQYNVQGLRAAMAFHAYDETAWPTLTQEELAEGKFENLFVAADPAVAGFPIYAPIESRGQNRSEGELSLEDAAHEIRSMAVYYYLIAENCGIQEAFINNVAECICAHSDDIHDDDASCFPGYVRRLANIAVGTPYGIPLTPLDSLYKNMTHKVLSGLRTAFQRLSAQEERDALYDALLFLPPTTYQELFCHHYYLPSGAEVTPAYIKNLIKVRCAFLEQVCGKTQSEKELEILELCAPNRETFFYLDEEKKMLWLAEEVFLLSLEPLCADITALYRQYASVVVEEDVTETVQSSVASAPETREAFIARHQHILPQDPTQRASMISRLESQFAARQPNPIIQFSQVATSASTPASAGVTPVYRTIGTDGLPVIHVSLRARSQSYRQ